MAHVRWSAGRESTLTDVNCGAILKGLGCVSEARLRQIGGFSAFAVYLEGIVTDLCLTYLLRRQIFELTQKVSILNSRPRNIGKTRLNNPVEALGNDSDCPNEQRRTENKKMNVMLSSRTNEVSLRNQIMKKKKKKKKKPPLQIPIGLYETYACRIPQRKTETLNHISERNLYARVVTSRNRQNLPAIAHKRGLMEIS
ncbi:hypothetical protein EYC80_007247 [Monilinia laxa]|uniref:Uncharacterized protein n=1 Tax=Monilinia laxa TaxID=61186 RepID=A0A5N6K0L6_MONLA|nr:hypothetical protein EYC80_007247 [Monilinia laxa]